MCTILDYVIDMHVIFYDRVVLLLQVLDGSGGQENAGEVRERGQGEEQRDLVPFMGSRHQPGGERQGEYLSLPPPPPLSLFLSLSLLPHFLLFLFHKNDPVSYLYYPSATGHGLLIY